MFRLLVAVGLCCLCFSALAQQDIIWQGGGPYVPVPGPAPGSLLVSTKHGYYYAPTGRAPFHRLSRAGLSGAPLNLLNRYYWYDVLPSGHLVTRDEEGKLEVV